MTSQPKRCNSSTTSLPSSPEPNNITRVAEGDNGVPRVVTGCCSKRIRGRQYTTLATRGRTLRPTAWLIRLRDLAPAGPPREDHARTPDRQCAGSAPHDFHCHRRVGGGGPANNLGCERPTGRAA